MKIAVIGATSQTGTLLLNQALDEGHEVVAYVRRPEAISPVPGLSIVTGQIDNVETMCRALVGCDAVVVILGWKLGKPFIPLYSIAIPTLIKAAQQVGLKRVVVMSALGVGNTYKNTRYPYRLGCRTFLRQIFEDHRIGESQLIGTNIKWTTVHPGPLMNGSKTLSPTIADAATGFAMPGSPRTNRADVASLMLKLIDDQKSFGKEIMITSIQSS